MEMEQKFCLDRGLCWEKWYRHTYKPYLLKPFLFIYTNGAVNGALWGFSSAEWRCQTVRLCACDCVLVISVSLLLCPGRYSTFTWYLDIFSLFKPFRKCELTSPFLQLMYRLLTKDTQTHAHTLPHIVRLLLSFSLSWSGWTLHDSLEYLILIGLLWHSVVKNFVITI